MALNAAIEVARAGEHGKGFAVVANEVKNLAEESKRETVEIGELIKMIQVDTEKAVKKIDHSSKNVSAEAQIISAAVEKQSASMEQIASSSKDLAKMAQSLDEETKKFKL